jgi:hypothetical protein
LVGRLLAQAQQTDNQEDERHGKGRSGDDLPAELPDAEKRLERIRAAKRALEQEAAQALEQARRDSPAGGRPGRPRKGEAPRGSQAERWKKKHRLRRARKNAAEPTRRFNLTDPDSRVMRDNGLGCFVQSYNAQIAADNQAQVIIAADVTQNVVDRAELIPMCERMKEALGTLPPVISADAGYWDSTSIEDPALGGAELLITPDAVHPGAKPRRTRAGSAAQRMRDKLKSAAAQTLYAMRRAIVEPVFGHIIQTRGLRRFTFRGLPQVRAEWNLICLTHDLLKLSRRRWLPQTP